MGEHIPEAGLAARFAHQHFVEQFPGLAGGDAVQNLQRVEHRVYGAEGINFSLIERLHGLSSPSGRASERPPHAACERDLMCIAPAYPPVKVLDRTPGNVYRWTFINYIPIT